MIGSGHRWAWVTLVAWSLAGCQPKPPPPRDDLAELVARCVDAMTRDACLAQRDSRPDKLGAAPEVFVAGVGAIDAQAYREIRNAGEAMCGLVRSRCERDWDDSACQAARSLWPGVPP